MPRGKNARRTLNADDAASNPTSYEVSSAAAGASVDITDAALLSALGYTPTDDQFINDFDVKRVAHTTPADEAAATISLASVLRNGGDDGWTVTFSAAAAATKVVRVRVVAR